MVKEKTKKEKSLKVVCIILIILILICIFIIFSLVNKTENALTPDYAPGTIDTNAIKEKDDNEKMDAPSGGGAVSLSYSNIVAINLETKKIKMFFKNPSKSLESIVVELVLNQNGKEHVLAKSDLLPPGYTLYSMNFNSSVELPKGGYNGIFKITYYDEKTGEKQMINTEIEVSIEVS